MSTQPSPARRWQNHLYVHGSESRINHQPGPANKPSGQHGFLLARLSPPASKPSERTLGAAGDEASQFGSDCKHEPRQPPPLQGQPACAWVLHVSPPLPRKAPSLIGLSSTSGGFPAKHVGQDAHKQLLRFQIPPCTSPSLNITELQLLLLWRTHAELPSLTTRQRSPHSSSWQGLFHNVF